MTTQVSARRPFFDPTVVLLLTAAWSTVPYARQDNANDGFIFFTTDRDNPSGLGVCSNCEDIYVMCPDGHEPGPPYAWWRRRSGYGGLQQRRRRLVAQQEAGRVPEQSGESCSADSPDECRWQ